ncbi:CDP-alcohol phosphatidyltransferase family protein [Apibacter sp. B3889]|uniref:CDP-alcohol phosphatidyltransferase family protein n=1 Tax=unclassified Apibacter TaxID=2630820 RepID=UPI00132717E4|nr:MULTISPECIES: CDP-alcohol phosphatidyltransferase family protein [unclassified Apibacter]MXO34115.1 CDP-alcohol phosphatidyltransferase family protein [Apibacter sp. B3883]MXO41754.1 CDP-alcohol phosphatidyltransferase family protein [Apibacter sp. B3889]MXP03324.1 CDP-alcohol phosphatidyltransferase family protein [Apibacter sp. B3887]MXP07413.1 CDP-alcohol phosphatidyltransferase family protein [Apibacter sp. B3935]
MRTVPKILMIFRLLLAPLSIILSYHYGERCVPMLVLILCLGLISDILDGIIARKYQVATENLRRMDSFIDIIFWLSLAISTGIVRPGIIEANLIFIVGLVILEGISALISFLRFGKEASTHAYSSKFWGITLFLALISILGFNYGGFFLYLTIIVGYISYVDVLLILILLPHWVHDVPSFFHAYLIRKKINLKKKYIRFSY